MAPITATRIVFSQTPLSEYAGRYAIVFDNVFTPSECASLVSKAESPTPWRNVGSKSARTRFSERILYDNAETADMIFQRLEPFLRKDVEQLGPENEWTNSITNDTDWKQWSKARGENGYWKMLGLNERLRFLRYRPAAGHFFYPHCDTVYSEKSRRSLLTAHLYLNEDVEGGATRFWTQDRSKWLDVEPKAGRVLVFQQRQLWHSGEAVTEGVKYTVRTDVMFEPMVISREERRQEGERRRAAKSLQSK